MALFLKEQKIFYGKIMNTEFNKLSEAKKYILQIIKDIKFGSVEVVIHDAKIVYLEKKEKYRFDKK